ncbi:MAG: 50S ribosomal protein L10 [Endomicrobiales bacterium]|nr:50S ribosomal protein L10 [Endomicrobiales bacterium]
MPSKVKISQVQELTDKFKNNKALVLTEYHGLTVSEISELKSKLRSHNCDYKVVKNTLTRRALKDLGLEEFSKHFSGPVAVAFEKGDPVDATKVLVDFSKEHNNLKLKAGMLGDKIISLQEIKSIASLPKREVLLAHILGTMQAPISGFANVLAGVIRNLLNVMNEIKKQKEEKK